MTAELLTAVGYGRRVGLRVAASEIAAVHEMLPFWWSAAEVEPERVWDVPTGGAESVVRAMELWVAEHAVERVFVHAGAVAISGKALLLPGRSHTGKTTLTAALLSEGATYLSDEYAVLDHRGFVHPYPRALSLRRSDGSRRRVTAAELGAATGAGPIEVRGVAVLNYAPAQPRQVLEISAANAALRLLDNTVCARGRPAEALAAIQAAMTNTVSVEGRHTDADDTARRLMALLRD